MISADMTGKQVIFITGGGESVPAIVIGHNAENAELLDLCVFDRIGCYPLLGVAEMPEGSDVVRVTWHL